MDPFTGLSLGRVALGVTALAKPDLLDKMPPPDGSRSTPLMTQAFASREIALGVLTLVASRSTRRTAALIGIFVDGMDAVAAQQAIRNRGVDPKAGTALTGVAVGAVVIGASAAFGPRPRKRTKQAEEA